MRAIKKLARMCALLGAFSFVAFPLHAEYLSETWVSANWDVGKHGSAISAANAACQAFADNAAGYTWTGGFWEYTQTSDTRVDFKCTFNDGTNDTEGPAYNVQKVVLCTAPEMWDTTTNMCVNPTTVCSSKSGTTVDGEVMIHDGTAPTVGAYTNNTLDYEGCAVTQGSTNTCYSKPDSGNPSATYCNISLNYTGDVYGGTFPPVDPPDPGNKTPVNDLDGSYGPTYGNDTSNGMPSCVGDTCTQTNTNTTTQTPSGTIQYDGTTLQIDVDYGNDGTSTTTITTVTAPDGSQTITSVTNNTTITHGQQYINSGPSGTTQSNTPPKQKDSSTTNTVVKDSEGNVISDETTTTEDPEMEGQPDTGQYVNPNFSDIDNRIQGYQTAPTGPAHSPEFGLNISFGQACSNGNYSINYMGFTGTIAICEYVGYTQTILYWVFALFTAVFIFHSVSQVNKG